MCLATAYAVGGHTLGVDKKQENKNMKNILGNSNFGFTKWCVALLAAGWIGAVANAQTTILSEDFTRSEERRVGKECAITCRSRWSPYH